MRSLPPAFSWERNHLDRHFSERDVRAPRGNERLLENRLFVRLAFKNLHFYLAIGSYLAFTLVILDFLIQFLFAMLE